MGTHKKVGTLIDWSAFRAPRTAEQEKHIGGVFTLLDDQLPCVEANLLGALDEGLGQLVEDRTGWSIRKFVRIARRYRTVHIRADSQLTRTTVR